MPTHLYMAPAAAGKTSYVLALVRDAAQGLPATPRVCVPTYLQARAWRRRLAETGGALGVRVLTFDRLYAECLTASGEVYTELAEPVQYRLLRTIADDLALAHYAPLTDRPGFTQLVQGLIGELKAARIRPEDFTRAVVALGDEPRLRELADLYLAYQERLRAFGWADRAGIGWLAVEALEERAPGVARDWPLLVVDGFDNFTEVQIALLKVLSGRVGQLLITLTGVTDGAARSLAHQRFNATRRRLEMALQVKAEPLPASQGQSLPTPALAYLEAHLFGRHVEPLDGAGSVELIEAPDRAAEVRAALRWLKARLASDGMRPANVALLARSISPYRPFILQTAAEYGLPIRLIDGLPLRANSAVAALLDLLRLMLPRPDDRQPALPLRPVVETWRSPYFDWLALPVDGEPEPIGIAPGDAEALDTAARFGRVIGGLAQWEEALTTLAGLSPQTADDEESDLPANVPSGAQAQALLDKFRRFVSRLTPPPGAQHYRDFAGWLEALIGPDPAAGAARFPTPEAPTALQMVARARSAVPEIAELDIAAFSALKDALRGLVWAEEAVASDQLVDFPRFFADLVGVIDATSYRPPIQPGLEEILVADVVQARGTRFRAVALLGLAEGEFPAVLGEDPFLRDADRQQLRLSFGFPLDLSSTSAETEFFYEAVTRPWERLLLTRPRLADNGAPWQASPFWEEVRRRLNVPAASLTSESVPPPGQVASWPELMESLSAYPRHAALEAWVRQAAPDRLEAWESAARLFTQRSSGASPGAFDGDLSSLTEEFATRFGPDRPWSASRLEAYRTCPFMFLIGSALALEPRAAPAEGLDARQLGNIYHHILKDLYAAAGSDLDRQLAAVEGVAARVLDAAPRQEGFRETAWWMQTRAQIVEDVRRSIQALAEPTAGFTPVGLELRFFGSDALTVSDSDDYFRLHGLIDRVDRAPDGRLLIVDYKAGGPSSFTPRAVAEGKKLQIPLYALAARDALELGELAEGFYWHVRHAEPSGFSLSQFAGGPEAAVRVAVEKAWEAVRGARAGRFAPHPPDEGCPAYCSAAAFCWHYRPRFGG